MCVKGEVGGKLSENGKLLSLLHRCVYDILEFGAEQNHVTRVLKDPKVGSECTNSK